jgi:two-component system, NarL family, response regulator LiaR
MEEQIHILVVDDNLSIRRELMTLLKRESNFNLIENGASNGEEAIALCSAFNPHVVLMDLLMPVMDGVTATRIIHDFYPNIQVLIFSNAREEMIGEALAAGASDWLSKVTTPSYLIRI